MICQNCQQDVQLAKNPQTGEFICPECGRIQQERSADQSTIAQTAHALLKRWEESRAQQGSAPAPKKSAATESTPAPAARTQPVQPEKIQTVASESRDRPVNSSREKLSEAEWDSLTAMQGQPELTYEESEKSAADTYGLAPSHSVPAPTEKRPAKKASDDDSSYKKALLESLSSRNDASQLVKQPIQQTPAEEVTQQATFHSESPRPSRDQRPSVSPSSSGQVRFKQESVSDMLNDLEVQQAIEKNQRKPRNWSAILGQLLVFSGAIAMTGGGAIVIGNIYGSLEIAITNGWLAVAGGHLLFVLGIYTHLSSRIDQTWKEMHERADEMQKLMLQQNQMQQVLVSQLGTSGTKPSSSSDRFRTPASEYAGIGG